MTLKPTFKIIHFLAGKPAQQHTRRGGVGATGGWAASVKQSHIEQKMPAHYLINDRTKQATKPAITPTTISTLATIHARPPRRPRGRQWQSALELCRFRAGLIWRFSIQLSLPQPTGFGLAASISCGSHTNDYNNNTHNELHQPQILSLSFIHFVSFILFIYLLASSSSSFAGIAATAGAGAGAGACHSVHMPHFALSWIFTHQRSIRQAGVKFLMANEIIKSRKREDKKEPAML